VNRPRLLLVLLVVLATWPLFGAGFAYDDLIIIVGNPTIDSISPSSIAAIFSQNYWYPHLTTDNLYRPIAVLSHAFEHALAGESPLLYHVVNIALHAVNVLLLYGLLTHLKTFDRLGCIIGAAVFAVHPAISEAVCNVTCRADLLVVTFVLLAATLTTSTAHKRRLMWQLPTLALLALYTKENGLLLIPVIAVVDSLREMGRDRVGVVGGFTRAVRKHYQIYAVAISIVAIGWIVRSTVVGGMVPSTLITPPELNILAYESASVRMMTSIKIYGLAAAKFVWPHPLTFDYGTMTIEPVRRPWELSFLIPLITMISAMSWVFRRGSQAPSVAAGILLFVGCFLPVSNFLFPITTIFNERLLYLPAIGICFTIASVPFSSIPRPAVISVTTALVMLLASVFVFRAQDWKSHESIIESSATASPRSANALLDLARIRQEQGDAEAMQQLIERAVAAFPWSPRANYSLGHVYLKQGDTEEAIQRFSVSLTDRPTQTSLMSAMNIGLIHARSGNATLAIDYFERALTINPREPGAHHNLALLYRGRNPELSKRHARIAAELGRPVQKQ